MKESSGAPPLLTIAVPTYNREALLKLCLDHIVEQIEGGIEIIVCDNASTDGTARLVAEYSRRFPFIRFLRNDENLRADGNMLRCLRESRGRYVHLLSDDDVLLPGSVAKILETLRRHDGAGFIYLNSRRFAGTFSQDKLGEPHYPIGDDLIFDDKNDFLRYIHIQATFMSAMVLNREYFTRIKNPERFLGTFLLQAHIAVACAGAASLNIVIAHPCIAYLADNSGGDYSLYGVFADKWKSVLFETGIASGFDETALHDVYVRTIKSFLRPMTMEIKISKTSFDSSGMGMLFRRTWKYPAAWIYLYPFIVLPAGFSRIVKKAINLIKKHS